MIHDSITHLIKTKNSKLLSEITNYDEVELTDFVGSTGFHDKVIFSFFIFMGSFVSDDFQLSKNLQLISMFD